MSPTPLTPEQKARITPQMMAVARRQAMYAWAKNRKQDGEELVAVAFQGLVTAAKNFDPERADIDPDDLASGKAFAGYALQRISGSLLDWQRKADFVPRQVRKTYKELQAIGHGESDITTNHLASATGLPESTIRRVVAAVEAMPISLDDQIDPREKNPHDDIASGDTVQAYRYASDSDVESDALMLYVCKSMAQTWADLPFLERAAIANKFYYGKSVKQAADAIGCSSTALRKALARAMEALLADLRETARTH